MNFLGGVEANIIGSNYSSSDIFSEIIKITPTSLSFFAALTIFNIGAGKLAPGKK